MVVVEAGGSGVGGWWWRRKRVVVVGGCGGGKGDNCVSVRIILKINIHQGSTVTFIKTLIEIDDYKVYFETNYYIIYSNIQVY